ncbi:HindIII family type II restriction endonuclease [Thiobaca trueperi]|uniref:Type II restriction enzyme n=1 Tax=Thiobaca trueperi TaxID=127458 RepID=A0A4R3N9Z1_9GAMM|nr:HindIII family type II restriction endonuclease [Thiobaca trueperi]TCT23809.1 type II restriction enzyme [Thiobaca trueperi]
MKDEARQRRSYWVAELEKLSGSFGDDSVRMIAELQAEIARDGIDALADHLHFCGAMPERYGHDSSAEKLYAKYTDVLVSEVLNAIGLNSMVITARADAADVQARARLYSLVADAKSFRLSRTAKNQKDFKIQAMDSWRNGLDYAMVVCPIYQLPGKNSQIYQQAIVRNVCILSYTHLGALVALAREKSPAMAEQGLHRILDKVAQLHPSKNARDYWVGINETLISVLGKHKHLWKIEKQESLEGLELVKQEALSYLQFERHRLLGLSHQEVLKELLKSVGLDARIAQIERLQYGGLLET